jgi:hypothetical protein
LSNRTRLSLDLRELLFALDELVRTKPEDRLIVLNPSPENHDWVGRARALIGSWDESREMMFQRHTDSLFGPLKHDDTACGALAAIMNTIQEARNELRLITGVRVSGAFDAVGLTRLCGDRHSRVRSTGQPFDFYDELRKVLETAQRDVLFVDRWMGADFVASYLPHVRSGVSVRLLTRDLLEKLTASVAVFVVQTPLQIAIRTSKNFHGRFLCIDGARAFLVDASFKDAAKSAPAALIELTDTAAPSINQYEAVWASGTEVRNP